ncbi:MAG: MucB/RseB C-terminal domain-containing protein [Pseudomonadota bacterium]|nr:MucB/RseB C-terminal domain-containing protein [Pseudomonadota bacterium]
MIARAALVVIYALLSLHSVTYADEQAEPGPAWLGRMVQAADELSYEGVFVFVKDGVLEAARVIHRGSEGHRTRIVSLNGELREIHRVEGRVIRYFPARGIMVEGARGFPPFFSGWPNNVERVLAHYKLHDEGPDRVADRPCQRTAVVPKDEYRFGYLLCLDRDTGLLLDAQMIDDRRLVRQQVMFAQLRIGGVTDDSDFEPNVDESQLKKHPHVGTSAMPPPDDVVRWYAAELPPGFETMMHGIRRHPDVDHDVQQVVYSDGLTAISVFVSPILEDGDVFTGEFQKGSANAYGFVVEGHQITVVGEAPYPTLRLIGESMRQGDMAD